MLKPKDQSTVFELSSKDGEGGRGVRERFICSWKLKSIIVTHNKHKIYPFGRHVTGFLVYCGDNYMAVQIMMPRHYPVTYKKKLSFKLEELAQTLKAVGYLGYYGKFEIDTHHQRVIHYVEGSIAQPIVGRKEVRHYKFIDDPSASSGQRLILSSRNRELTWLRKH